MFGLGTQELIIILVIVLVIFGAGKLPQVGGALGKGIRNFKKGVQDIGGDDDDDDFSSKTPKEPKVIEPEKKDDQV